MNTEQELKLAKETIHLLEAQLYFIAYSVKSCRAGDGDTSTWKMIAENCEARAEAGLSIYKRFKNALGGKKL